MGMMALYTGATGMKSLSRGIQVVGNNLANVNTIGFKQQMALYEDLKYNTVDGASVNGARVDEGGGVGTAQLGKGVRVADIRTHHIQGAFELGSEVTDIAISGKGFFGVTKDGVERYTRAGNFRFDKDGNLNGPNGYTVLAYPVADGVVSPVATNLQLPLNADGRLTIEATPTTELTAILNLGSGDDKSVNATDPYFSLVTAWDGTQTPPLGDSSFTYSQPLRVFDSTGAAQELTMYFDGTGTPAPGGNTVYEYIVAADPGSVDGAAGAGKGLLMSGTLSFNSAGQLIDMSAFTPQGDPSTLTNWSQAPFEGGIPQFTAPFTGAAPQTMGLDMGIRSGGNAWAGGVADAATVGATAANLPGMATPEKSARATTAHTGTSSALFTDQDGFPEGYLQNISISREGILSGKFSNGAEKDLFQLAIFRFTSEHNLKREGNNHFSATIGSGEAQAGVPDTENYGFIAAKSLEQSNVDMATEFVHMITHQRGFQANSKIITTQEEILRKTIEIKR